MRQDGLICQHTAAYSVVTMVVSKRGNPMCELSNRDVKIKHVLKFKYVINVVRENVTRQSKGTWG